MDILTNSKLIVGCGNPGESYANSRHNIGFDFMDYLSEKLAIPLNFDKKKSIYGITYKKSSDKLILLKPQTFVGLSGESVLYLSAFFKVSVDNILVVYDDIKINFGEITRNNPKCIHSGIQNIKEEIKSDSFTSYGIGIGPLPKRMQLENFYLNHFAFEEKEQLEGVFSKLTKDVKKFIGKEFLDILDN